MRAETGVRKCYILIQICFLTFFVIGTSGAQSVRLKCPFINTKALSSIELLTVKLKLTCLSQVLTVLRVIMDKLLNEQKDRSPFNLYELISYIITYNLYHSYK